MIHHLFLQTATQKQRADLVQFGAKGIGEALEDTAPSYCRQGHQEEVVVAVIVKNVTALSVATAVQVLAVKAAMRAAAQQRSMRVRLS